MAPAVVHLPNGQNLTVTPVFGGLYFKSNDLLTGAQPHAFPPGWTIQIYSEADEEEKRQHPRPSTAAHTLHHNEQYPGEDKDRNIHRFKTPTLKNDHMFISSISNPSSNDFRPATSPTRQIAAMTWATLWWYFHQPAPSPYLTTAASQSTPEEGRPKGEWRLNINREGIFKGKHLLPKLERMGLISSEDSCVGLDPEDGVVSAGEGWTKMFVSRRSFWQLDARIYLFTLPPLQSASPYPAVSPANSRPASPNRNSTTIGENGASNTPAMHSHHGSGGGLWRANTPPGPFTSGSHLPTFYPPPPAQYTFTNSIRHPIRPKPPRQGETFYTRYIPSLGQYLSFRVASLSSKPCQYRGPVAPTNTMDVTLAPGTRESLRSGATNSPTNVPSSSAALATLSRMNLAERDTTQLTDCELLHKWMNDPRVAYSWGEQGPQTHQRAFLEHGLTSKHSFPVIGCFDGKPFGFFEIYWVKEDRLAAHCGAGDWDRGLHVLVGEQEFRGSHRVKVWLSALVHYCWLADLRTGRVMLEPRVDNKK